MLHELSEAKLDLSYQERSPRSNDFVLCYDKMSVLLNEALELPQVADLADKCHAELRYAFKIDKNFYYVLLEEKPEIVGFYPHELRLLRSHTKEQTAYALQFGAQLFQWYTAQRYCPYCAHKLEQVIGRRELACEACARIYYPRINPAVIVAICTDNAILLTKYQDRPYNHVALVAGYMEFGETPEACCQREAAEEVGLDLHELHYVCSQPWPVSESLLLGFVAYLKSEDVPELRDGELREARWYKRSEIPALNLDHSTLTNELIWRFYAEQLPHPSK